MGYFVNKDLPKNIKINNGKKGKSQYLRFTLVVKICVLCTYCKIIALLFVMEKS
jgi:hypothetical protein